MPDKKIMIKAAVFFSSLFPTHYNNIKLPDCCCYAKHRSFAGLYIKLCYNYYAWHRDVIRRIYFSQNHKIGRYDKRSYYRLSCILINHVDWCGKKQ